MQLISSLSLGSLGGDRAFRLLVEVVLVGAMAHKYGGYHCSLLPFVIKWRVAG